MIFTLAKLFVGVDVVITLLINEVCAWKNLNCGHLKVLYCRGISKVLIGLNFMWLYCKWLIWAKHCHVRYGCIMHIIDNPILIHKYWILCHVGDYIKFWTFWELFKLILQLNQKARVVCLWWNTFFIGCVIRWSRWSLHNQEKSRWPLMQFKAQLNKRVMMWWFMWVNTLLEILGFATVVCNWNSVACDTCNCKFV
jgi:hypothetical protein